MTGTNSEARKRADERWHKAEGVERGIDELTKVREPEPGVYFVRHLTGAPLEYHLAICGPCSWVERFEVDSLAKASFVGHQAAFHHEGRVR